MSVINKRNAVLGWLAWSATKQAAKHKARKATNGSGSRSRKALVPLALAAVGGALYFWRRQQNGTPEDPEA